MSDGPTTPETGDVESASTPAPMSYEDRRAAMEQYERAEADSYAAVTDPRVVAVLDVLAPVSYGSRSAIFEWGHETTPTAAEMIELAAKVVEAVDRTQL